MQIDLSGVETEELSNSPMTGVNFKCSVRSYGTYHSSHELMEEPLSILFGHAYVWLWRKQLLIVY